MKRTRMKKPKTTNHIVIEVDNPEKADRLFEEIQNKYSLYDNCVIERETPIENSIVDDDRWEENGGYLER